ncbi:MAG: Uma2 family endonuclease [Myxococcota bacterium]
MKALHRKPATYEDLKAIPDTMIAQIVGGELYASPRPAFGHARVSSVLGMKLGGPFDLGDGGPGGRWIFYEPELHLQRDILVPDLAGWRKARMPRPPAPSEPFLTLAPDWVCEVLSPSTASLDRVKKKHVYAREGVSHLWFIDPLARTLEVLRLDAGRWVEVDSYEGDAQVRPEPFEAVELDLAALWLPQENP